MDSMPAQLDDVARAVATKSFSAHVMYDHLGASADEAAEGITSLVMRVWGMAGYPPGAIRLAAELGAELTRRIAEDKAPDSLETSGVSRPEQVALAERSATFLTGLAAEIDTTPS